MKPLSSKWLWGADICILLLGVCLLWRLYAPSAPMSFAKPSIIAESDAITIEAIIRELHAHADQLPNTKREKLNQEISAAIIERDKLLELMEEANSIDTELNQLALEIWQQLSPEQQARLRETRNTISVDQLERAYWQETQEKLQDP